VGIADAGGRSKEGGRERNNGAVVKPRGVEPQSAAIWHAKAGEPKVKVSPQPARAGSSLARNGGVADAEMSVLGIIVECERTTLTRRTGSVTRSTAGKLGILGRGVQHVYQAFK
jgi:hypothetical protein